MNKVKRIIKLSVITLISVTLAFYFSLSIISKQLISLNEFSRISVSAVRMLHYLPYKPCREGIKYFDDAILEPISYDTLNLGGINHQYALPPFTAFVKEVDFKTKGRQYYTLTRRYGLSDEDILRNKEKGWQFIDEISGSYLFTKGDYWLNMNFTWQNNRCISTLTVGIRNSVTDDKTTHSYK